MACSESGSLPDLSTDSAYVTTSSPCPVRSGLPSSINLLSVFDVYDIAAAIGKEFEVIIDKHGPDTICNLMPKVIHVLEELEDYASRLETQESEVATLQNAVDRMELEKLDRTQERIRFEQEILKAEEVWHQESTELQQIIQRLTVENAQLTRILESASATVESLPTTPSDVNNEEIRLMLRLKDLIDRQKVEIRGLKRQLSQKAVDLDAMQQQADRLAKLNAVLRRKHGVSKLQASQLLEDKAELEMRLLAKEALIQDMREHVHQSLKSPNNVDNMTSMYPSMTTSLMTESCTSPINPITAMSEDQWVKLLNTEGKMILDTRDPNRPYFTVEELRKVLIERNELKSQIIEVEEELSVYRRAGDDDPPVQGPINKEPDEKLYFNRMRPALGVKQFFRTFLHRLQE